MSGRAFDNNCNCLDVYLQQQQLKNSSEPDENQAPESSASSTSSASSSSSASPPPPQIPRSLTSSFECACNAPRLAPEFEFTKALIQVGKKLVRLASKELKTQRLMSELAIVNMNLPARVWLPLYEFAHHVVRIPYRSAAVLNSKEKAPYIMYVEVLECESVHATPLPPKLLDNNLHLQSVKSEENLANSRLG
jgi:phosphatidylinositol 4-kinase